MQWIEQPGKQNRNIIWWTWHQCPVKGLLSLRAKLNLFGHSLLVGQNNVGSC